ncbi:MAG: hypothetical protein ACLGHE_04230 [Gammaproteobacteria bacterium]
MMARRALGTGCALVCLAVGQVVLAADARAVKGAYECAVRQHEMLTTYHLHAYEPKDRIAGADFKSARQVAQDCAGKVAEGLAAAGLAAKAAELGALRDKAGNTSAYNADSIARTGTQENAVVAEMVQHELALVAELVQAAKDLQQAGKVKDVPEARQARELAVLIMYANARYVERTTEVYHRDDSDEPTIDQLAARFNSGLSALRANRKLTAEQHKMLDNVNTRFRFINGSLNNYTQNAVPGTVNRHARSMVNLLNQVADGLDGIK